MSIFASILRSVYKLSGAKKAFALPEDALRKEIEKQNQHRGVFTPTDHKAHYETITVNGFPCLIVREHPKPSERAILYFFGGGMVIGPDKGDLPVMRKLCRETGCDVWFPFYPLCMEHCITETYAMVYECYRKMITLYGGGNVSTCGFSSGGALALGIAAHNNAQPEPLPQPRHIVVVSPGEVPWNDAERARMQALNKRDVSIDYRIKWYFAKTDLNTDKGKAENKKSVVKYAKWYTPEKEAKYPTSFKVDFVGQPYEGACYYRITRCPICIYAEKLGVSELMLLFCELDEVMITLQHGVLHRKQTLANGGEYCDYFITGNRE